MAPFEICGNFPDAAYFLNFWDYLIVDRFPDLWLVGGHYPAWFMVVPGMVGPTDSAAPRLRGRPARPSRSRSQILRGVL